MKFISKTAKILFVGFTTVVVILLAFSFWHRYLWMHFSDPTTKEFYQTLSKQRPVVDLSVIKTVDWDSLAFVGPYSDVCQYGIEGYEPGGANCFASMDDGECWLLFLQGNKLVTKVSIDRGRFDLTTSNFPHRLPRDQAKFKIDEDRGFAPVRIQK